jgi:NADH dehydrogenase [ubiquinone] 1 alpha subcomplex assembly factor 6
LRSTGADDYQLELHLVSTTVSQPALASIRYQFWRDALKAIFARDSTGVVPQHPVAVLLAETKRERPIQKYYLSQMIDTRVSIDRVRGLAPCLR